MFIERALKAKLLQVYFLTTHGPVISSIGEPLKAPIERTRKSYVELDSFVGLITRQEMSSPHTSSRHTSFTFRRCVYVASEVEYFENSTILDSQFNFI